MATAKKAKAPKVVKENYKKVMGVSITPASITAVEVSGHKRKPIIHKWAQIYMPPQFSQIATEQEGFVAFFKDFLKENNFTDLPLCFASTSQNIVMRMAQFPFVAPEKMKQVIALGAQQVLPVAVNDLIVDSVICNEYQQEGRTMVNALVIGAKKDYIQDLIQLSQGLGTTIINISVASLAALNSVESSLLKDKGNIVVFVDYEAITIFAFIKEDLKLVRMVSFDEKFVNTVLNPVTLEPKQYWHHRIDQEDFKTQILSDLRTSINFIENQSGTEIENIILCGEYHNLPFIQKNIEENFRVKVSCPRPYENFNHPLETQYASALGVALESLGD